MSKEMSEGKAMTETKKHIVIGEELQLLLL
jgi:hypothetical protein